MALKNSRSSASGLEFPDPRASDEQGLVCVGGKLSVELLLQAYGKGIFPWPQEGLPVLWFCPLDRGVLDFEDFREPRSFKQWKRKTNFDVRKNTAFDLVIEQCARVPRADNGTWILPDMIRVYKEMHRAGYAHSYEAFEGERLVGGLYGVDINGVFSGESMFFEKSGASKLCLVTLIEDLKSQGRTWVDTQMVTPVMAQFGGKLISRDDFLKRIEHRGPV